jgi:lysophospholipase L1-like esterase
MTMKRQTIISNLILLCISLAFSIGAAEMICRFLALSNDSDPSYKLAHPVLPFVLKPNSESVSLLGHTITINSHGLRDAEYPYRKPEGTFRILVLGDSIPFAYGQDAKDGYAKVLERRLNAVKDKKYAKIEVINAAHSGFNILDEYNYLRLYGLKYSPDALVVGVTNNDFTPESLNLVIEDGIDSAPGSLWLRLHVPPWVKKILRKSHLYMTVGWVYRNGGFGGFRSRDQVKMSRDDFKKTLETTAGHLQRLISLASENALPVYFVAQPGRQETMSRSYEVPQFIQQIRDLEKDGKLTFVDTIDDFANYALSTEEIFPIKDGVHPNAKGHQILADRLFESLIVKIQ